MFRNISPNSYVYQDLEMKKVIVSGHEKDRLYYLDIPEKTFTSVSTYPCSGISVWVIRLLISCIKLFLV